MSSSGYIFNLATISLGEVLFILLFNINFSSAPIIFPFLSFSS